MFKKIALENFKAFGERQEMPMAPITLIYGPNSAGKSSIIQSLLWMKQTCEPGLNESGGAIYRGGLVDLGSFNSIVHRHRPDATIGIEMVVSEIGMTVFPKPLNTTANIDHLLGLRLQRSRRRRGSRADDSSPITELSEVVVGRLGSPGAAPLSPALPPARFSWVPKASKSSDSNDPAEFILGPADSEARAKLQAFAGELLKYAKMNIEESDAQKSGTGEGRKGPPHLYDILNASLRASLEDIPESAVGTDISIWMEPEPRGFLPSFSAAVLIDQKSSHPYGRGQGGVLFTRVLNESLRIIIANLERISYLGPLRHPPERHYVLSGSGRRSVGTAGEYTAEVLHASSQRLRNELNRWLDTLEIPYQIEMKDVGDSVSGDLTLMALRERRLKVMVSPADVGFGVGQLLPILVEGLANSRRVICVEQPEIHLHPRLQGHLADFFIDTVQSNQSVDKGANSRRGGRAGSSPQMGVAQWIIETHSESLMLRLRKRIREGKIKPDLISVLYVVPGISDGSVVKQIRLNAEGDFKDEWPGGFFEERFEELM